MNRLISSLTTRRIVGPGGAAAALAATTAAAVIATQQQRSTTSSFYSPVTTTRADNGNAAVSNSSSSSRNDVVQDNDVRLSTTASSTFQNKEEQEVEDERTTCSICLINRQGPCRGPWRQFEACLKARGGTNSSNSSSREEGIQKDQEQVSNDETTKDEQTITNDNETDPMEHSAAECDDLMLSWLTCVQSYRNLYMLYYNYMSLKEVVEPMEKELRDDEVYEWKDVINVVDWTPYVQWVQSQGCSLWDLYWRLKLTAPPVTTSRPKFEGGADPHLVKVQVQLSLLENETGLPLRLAYAKDQGGGLLGMEHFGDKDDDKTSGQEGGTAGGATGTDATTAGEEKDGVFLTVAFRPERTSSIEFYAFYKNDADEVRMLYSGPIPLVMVAMENGEIPLGKM